MQNEEMPREPVSESEGIAAAPDLEVPRLERFSFRQVRTPMQVVGALLGLAAAASFAYAIYEFYYFWKTGGFFIPTTTSFWIALGHLLRAAGLGFLGWLLMKVGASIDATTGEPSDEFGVRLRGFWRASAVVLSVLAAGFALELGFARDRNSYEFFRPEFESEPIDIKPERIEFRRGSEPAIDGWEMRKIGESERTISVSPVAEITGKDIRRAVVRIAQMLPGSQHVELRVQFTDEGAAKLEKLTRSLLGSPLAVLVDGELRAAPRVFTAISGDARLTNIYTMEEIAAMIRKGQDR